MIDITALATPKGLKKIVIVGGEGLIGSSIARHMLSIGGFEITLVDIRLPQADAPAVHHQITKDILELDEAIFKGADCVIQLAAEKSVPQSFKSVGQAGRNLTLDEQVFKLATSAGVPKLLFASSCEVYGNSGHINKETDHQLEPQSPYAVGKLASEMLAQVYRQVGDSKICALRFHNAYGWRMGSEALVSRVVEKALCGQSFLLEGSGAQRRSLTFVDDVASMVCELVSAEGLPDVINIGSDKTYSVNEVIEVVRAAAGPINIKTVKPRINEIDTFTSDFSLQNGIVKSVLSTSLESGVLKVITAAKKEGL
jgi:dTDP-glucose 4,6-dehydratase/UDP-glucose 4-epimerase